VRNYILILYHCGLRNGLYLQNFIVSTRSILLHLKCRTHINYSNLITVTTLSSIYAQDVPGVEVSILRGHSIGHSKKKFYMNMCPIPNGFLDRAI
jgi:hypothetical protein